MKKYLHTDCGSWETATGEPGNNTEFKKPFRAKTSNLKAKNDKGIGNLRLQIPDIFPFPGTGVLVLVSIFNREIDIWIPGKAGNLFGRREKK